MECVVQRVRGVKQRVKQQALVVPPRVWMAATQKAVAGEGRGCLGMEAKVIGRIRPRVPHDGALACRVLAQEGGHVIHAAADHKPAVRFLVVRLYLFPAICSLRIEKGTSLRAIAAQTTI